MCSARTHPVHVCSMHMHMCTCTCTCTVSSTCATPSAALDVTDHRRTPRGNSGEVPFIVYTRQKVLSLSSAFVRAYIIHSWISVRRPSADLGHAHQSNAFANGASALPGALPSMPVRSEPTAHLLPQHAQASHPQPVLLIATTIVYRCDQPGFSRNPTTRLPPCLTVPSPALRSD